MTGVTGTDASPVRIGPIARYGLLVGPLLSMIDTSVVNIAVPDIAREMRASLDQVQWVVSGYLLALGVGLAVTSYLAKRYGTLRVYAVSMVLFVIASAACAVAPSIETLIAFRAVQGFAGAPLFPLALSMLFSRLENGKIPVSAAFTLFLAPTLGPTIGGLLIGAGGWRWIFLVNVPVGILGMLMLLRVPKTVGAAAERSTRFDPVGFVLLAVGITAVLFGSKEGTSEGWDKPIAFLPVACGLLLLAAYAVWALRQEHPVVDLKMVRHRDSAVALVLQTLCSVVTFGTIFLMPVFTQSVQGYSALDTGLALLPQGVIMAVGTVLGQRLAAHMSLRLLVFLGFAILAASSLFLVLIAADTPLWVTAVMLCGRALAIGFVTTPLLMSMLAPLAEREQADGNTLFNITQRVGGSLGVGILGSLVAGGATLAATVDAFHLVGWIMIALAAVAAVIALSLGARTPVVE